MAMQEETPAHNAQFVGNAFVEQYYHILHESPELVHRFYQDSSSLSRQDNDGVMTTVSTMQEINDKILSLNYRDFTAEIKTADAQDSYEKGVIVLVTGCLTGKDNMGKKFTQTFFLAPQDKGYFVLNDVFRFVEENEELQISSVVSVPANDISEKSSVSALAAEPEPAQVDNHVVHPAESIEDGNLDNGAEVYDPTDKEEGSVIEHQPVEPPTQSSQTEIVTGADSTPAVPEDAPKKSYASILKVMKSHPASSSVHISNNKVRRAPISTAQQSFSPVKPATTPAALARSSESAPESSNTNEEAAGHSIYVRNLPYSATPAQLEELFRQFGPIKHNGIQVRSNKQGFTFGFVEFETGSSMHSALEASPITVGERQAVVEEKRTNTRVGSSSGGGKFPPGRNNFRSGRGNFGGGRGFGRNEFRNQGEFSGRQKGPTSRSPDGYEKVNQNGSGSGRGGGGGRQGGANP